MILRVVNDARATLDGLNPLPDGGSNYLRSIKSTSVAW